jgi:tetratricopeptide (TPR) repeat protein
VNVNYGVILMIAGRYPEALAQYRKTIEREPAFNPPHYYLSQLYAMTGHFDEAISEFQKTTHFPGSFNADAQGYNKLVGLRSNDFKAPAVFGLTFVLAGNRDKGFEYFEKAYSIEDGDLIQTLRYPALDPIRSDPRYADLMRRLGLPQ